MFRNRGYALIETLLALVILATGLVTSAALFSVTTTVNIRNRQRTAATLLVYDKMEQLRSSVSMPGGGLDPSNPVAGFVEYVHFDDDGAVQVDITDSQAPYLRLWQIEASVPRTITIAVFGRLGASVPLELARASGSW